MSKFIVVCSVLLYFAWLVYEMLKCTTIVVE